MEIDIMIFYIEYSNRYKFILEILFTSALFCSVFINVFSLHYGMINKMKMQFCVSLNKNISTICN